MSAPTRASQNGDTALLHRHVGGAVRLVLRRPCGRRRRPSPAPRCASCAASRSSNMSLLSSRLQSGSGMSSSVGAAAIFRLAGGDVGRAGGASCARADTAPAPASASSTLDPVSLFWKSSTVSPPDARTTCVRSGSKLWQAGSAACGNNAQAVMLSGQSAVRPGCCEAKASDQAIFGSVDRRVRPPVRPDRRCRPRRACWRAARP